MAIIKEITSSGQKGLVAIMETGERLSHKWELCPKLGSANVAKERLCDFTSLFLLTRDHGVYRDMGFMSHRKS